MSSLLLFNLCPPVSLAKESGQIFPSNQYGLSDESLLHLIFVNEEQTACVKWGKASSGGLPYANDLLWLAPSRSAIENMLKVCEDYAEDNHLEFSTDQDPSKSKSKCIFMQGNMQQPKQVNLQWVKTATHLGHELSEICNMEEDMK
jgi:hypothetical protein